jgi:hypothetical protein
MPDPVRPVTPPRPPLLLPQEMERLSTLFHQLAHHKDTRGPLARMVKHVGSPVAAAFTDVTLEDKFAQLNKKLDDRLLQDQINAASNAQARQRNTLKEAGRSDEEIANIEKVMSRVGLGDYDAGARLYDSYNPPADPSDHGPDAWNETGVWEFPTLPGADGKPMAFKDFAKDPAKATRAAAYTAIDEFKRSRLPRAFARA